MEWPDPRFVGAHAVIGLPEPLPQRPDVDDVFVAAVAEDFPNLVTRQTPLAGLQIAGPRLVLTSKSSQLIVSAGQADFDVRFYGDYITDVRRGLEFVGRKLASIRNGFEAVGLTPATIGVIANFQFSFKDTGENPALHILGTHLRSEVDPDHVQDAIARVALRVRDTYFVNLGVANYESRIWQRPILPGTPQPVTVKAWEGSIEDFGVELTVDINNGLEGRVNRRDPEVTEQGVAAVLALLERVAQETGPRFVETGEVRIEALIEEPA